MSQASKDLTVITSIVMAGGPRGVAEQRIVQTKLQAIRKLVRALEDQDTAADVDVEALAIVRADARVKELTAQLQTLQHAHDALEQDVAALTRELAAAKKTHRKKPGRKPAKPKAKANDND